MSREVHMKKLDFFCRVCGEADLTKPVNSMVKKSNIGDLIFECYQSDFSEDNDSEHPDKVCKSCYSKLKNWKVQKKKFDKNKKRNLENNIEFDPKITLPCDLTQGYLPCSSDGTCKVCSIKVKDPNENIEPSPSKYMKLSEHPFVSPSDALKNSPATSRATKPDKAKRSILVEKTHPQLESEVDAERVKIYVSDKVFDINQFVDMEVALLFVCSVCSEVPKDPFKVAGCQHIVCYQCIINYKSQTKSSKCPFQDCGQVYNETDIVPISGRDRSVYNTLRTNCANKSCKVQCRIPQMELHSESCRTRGAYNYKTVGLRGKRSNFVDEKIKDIKNKLEEICEVNKLDKADTLFYILADILKQNGSALSKNVDSLYESYSAGIDNIDDYLPEKPNPIRSAALKSFANLTVGQYMKIVEFEKGEANKDGTKLAPYKAMLKAEKECDVGNTNYKLVDKVTKHIVKVHEATLDDPSITISEDVGCLPPGHLNIPVDGARVSLVDSVANALTQKYPEIVKAVGQHFPGLWLPDFTLRAHVKVAWDGTLGISKTAKEMERDESDHWLAGCAGLLQVDLELGDGRRSVLWTEQTPNSILSCIPVGLYKGEEGNRPTLSYIMTAIDTEIEDLGKTLMELETLATVPSHVLKNHEISQDLMNIDDVVASDQVESLEDQELEITNPLRYDDVVKEDFLRDFVELEGSVTKSADVQQVHMVQRFNIRVTSPKDEKFDRNVRGKAGSGSARPCVHCSLSLKECMSDQHLGTLPIEYTNDLEREASDFCLDNPLEWSRHELDEVSYGMKRMRLTNSEVCKDVTDSLHLHINVSGSLMFKIGCRIFCFGGDEKSVFHWDKTAAVKEKIEQAEVKYAKSLKSVFPALPSLNQMPGNFGRAYVASENRDAVLGPLPDCQEKRTFSSILELWENMCIIHCKVSPTPLERLDYDRLAREIQTQISSMKWIKRLPNQFIRACHHNGIFLNDPEGTGSIGPHSTEPLESGNHWIKMYDDGYTFRGDRAAAIKGVFKLRRMKSSGKLQNFYPKQDIQIQKCSVCHNSGHNKRSIACPGPEQETVEENTEDNQGEDTVEAEDLEMDSDDAGDVEEEENILETSHSYYAFHFVDETVIDD